MEFWVYDTLGGGVGGAGPLEVVMEVVGTVASLWRYPVKSMRGERMGTMFAGFPGIYGDRMFAIHDAGAAAGFPFLTAREKPEMLLWRASFRERERSERPENLAAAEAMSFDLSSVWVEPAELEVEVDVGEGRRLGVEDPALLTLLAEGLGERHKLSLLRSQRALVDCRPVALFGMVTAEQLGQEAGMEVDARRFRANVYLDLKEGRGFAEDSTVGRRLRIGERVELMVLERDNRCKMITLNPDTAEASPELMKAVARGHEGRAGVYAAVLVEGTMREGEEVVLLG